MITLECNHSKKIGLPGYASHQFSITLRTELTDVAQVLRIGMLDHVILGQTNQSPNELGCFHRKETPWTHNTSKG
jgi:hypothetical protein